MGELDSIKRLFHKSHILLRQHTVPDVSASRPQAVPYLAASPGNEQRYDAYYARQTAEPSAGAAGASPRRYMGRSAAHAAQLAADRQQRRQEVAAPTMLGPRITRSAVVPWSFRLALAVTVVAALLLVWRLPGLLTPPVDSPVGAEATHAAFANLLAGRVDAPLEPVRLLPPPAPWFGEAPANPAAGLPLYGWITAALMGLLDSGAWVGRAVSVGFSLLAGLFLFGVVRRSAGTRAAIYAMLFFSFAPVSVALGQQFSPAALILAAQCWAMLTLVKWRLSVGAGRAQGSSLSFMVAVASGALAGLLDPGAIFLALPAAYLFIAPDTAEDTVFSPFNRKQNKPANTWGDAWRQSPNQGKLIGYVSAVGGASLIWWVFTQGAAASLWLGAGDGGGGVASALATLFSGGAYVQIVGLLVERLLTVVGLLLLGAGLLNAARPPMQMLFHVWLAGGLLHILLDASRLARHDDVLLPLILPACALAGIGAAWAAALPARLWLALNEQKRDRESDYAISPQTSWLLDLPEERIYPDKAPRPQAQLALGKSVAQRSQTQGLKLRRAGLLTAGHLAVLTALGLVVASGAHTIFARLQPSVQSAEVAEIGAEVQSVTPPGSRLIIAGPYAPELFYSSGRTGWALSRDDFSMAEVQTLQREGAAYLLSADQEWLGHHPDYRGLITTYGVQKLARNYILFDLNAKPATNDRLYFLESGHTLGGAFRAYWERNGGVARLGYPISEELVENNPLDGQQRTVQYFERAVLEYHAEKEGTPDTVMLASVGLWVTQGRDFPRAAPAKSAPDRWYFAETGHIVKEAFLRYWQGQGGLAMFGYPISEELPEINPGDGKVYTVQYFERARFEWHPTFAGTPDEVQLGLIGKQALEMPKK